MVFHDASMHRFWEARTVVEHACFEEAKTGNDLIGHALVSESDNG